jgi:hypothetical protein
VLDLRAVTFMDSSGLALMLDGDRAAPLRRLASPSCIERAARPGALAAGRLTYLVPGRVEPHPSEHGQSDAARACLPSR